ncbi:MAG TPA: hypothetical protein PKM20_00345 [Nitrosomonas sp.]|nr:hypothetical protein [Nitrosomonas sp.]
MLKLWQELQEIKPDFDNRGSKNSILPSSTISGLAGFTALIGCIGSLVADALIEATSAPIDSNETTSIRILIDILPKKTADNGAADYA